MWNPMEVQEYGLCLPALVCAHVMVVIGEIRWGWCGLVSWLIGNLRDVKGTVWIGGAGTLT
jgi:hypothetical protein